MEHLPAIQQVDRYVHQRRYTDQKFVSWPIYFFLLSWITLGIYVCVIFYRRLNRADLFRNRKAHYYDAVVDATRQYAEQTGKGDSVHNDLADLDRYTRERFEDEHKPINAGLSFVLAIVTLGIYGWYAIHRLMRFWWEIQLTEQDFDEKISMVWMRLDLVRYPLTFEPDEQLRRSFWMHFLLAIVTLGIYGIIWDYRLHTDPERVYPEFHTAEDSVLNTLRAVPAPH